jgi:hypothetical protein
MKRIVLFVAMAVAFNGCACKKPDPVVAGRVVIDCLAQNQGDLGTLRAELLPLIMTGDWTAFEAKAKAAGIDIGGCVAAELINRYLAPAPGNAAPPPEQSQAARATMDRLRTGWNGATFKTSQGEL